MKDINNLFFELIRVAIGNQVCLSRTPKVNEWQELYAMAKKQSLVGICFAGVQKLQAQRQAPNSWGNEQGEMLYLQWLGMAAKIQQRNEAINKRCVELQERLTKDAFRSCILKGQGNSENYGSLAMLRQSGDIDIWVEGGFEKINSFIQANWPTNDVNDHHIHVGIYHDTEVEIHYIPFLLNNPLKNKVLLEFFRNQESLQFAHKSALPSGDYIIAADNSFNIVFQFVHIFHHLFTEGIGLRQLMDYYFVLRTSYENQNEGEYRNKNVLRVVHDLSLERFASALMWVIKTVFVGHENEDENKNWMPWKPNEKDGRFLLNEIMQSGNFGHHDERIPKQMSYWKSFWYLNFYNLRLIRFDYWSCFWTPIMRIKVFCWRKLNDYK